MRNQSCTTCATTRPRSNSEVDPRPSETNKRCLLQQLLNHLFFSQGAGPPRHPSCPSRFLWSFLFRGVSRIHLPRKAFSPASLFSLLQIRANEVVQERLSIQKDGLYLYRNIIPPQVPDLAFIGSEVSTFNNILTHAMQLTS